MCSGAKDYHCWNGLSFEGKLAAKKIADALGVTHPVVPQAMKLHRGMDRLRTDDLYEFLTGPPAGSNGVVGL